MRGWRGEKGACLARPAPAGKSDNESVVVDVEGLCETPASGIESGIEIVVQISDARTLPHGSVSKSILAGGAPANDDSRVVDGIGLSECPTRCGGQLSDQTTIPKYGVSRGLVRCHTRSDDLAGIIDTQRRAVCAAFSEAAEVDG